MASFQFACPHCQGFFQVEDPPTGRPLACPNCRRLVALPGESPQPVADVSPAAAIGESDGVEEPAGAALPFDPFEYEQAAAVRSRRKRRRIQREVVANVRQLSPQQKKRRRQVRSAIVMVLCGVVLVVAVVLLSRL